MSKKTKKNILTKKIWTFEGGENMGLPKSTKVGKVVKYKGKKYKRVAMTGFPQWKFVK